MLSFFKKQFLKGRASTEETLNKQSDYFVQATHWHDDVYTTILISRNRYQAAFLLAILCVGLLGAAIIAMTPLEKTQMVVVHQQQDGYVWVSTTKASTLDLTQSESQIKQSIADYIRLRESYHPETYRENAQLVKYFSAASVEHGFLSEQNESDSPVIALGTKQFRTIKDITVQLLSAETRGKANFVQAKNVALVRFTMVDKEMDGRETKVTHEQAFITYAWQGEPDDPELKLINYNGFTIKSYEKTIVNADVDSSGSPSLDAAVPSIPSTSGEKTS